jgi:hypothetical protein
MGARQKEQIYAVMDGPLRTAVRWYVLVFGANMLAPTIWNLYLALAQRDPSRRAAEVKYVVVGTAWTCSALIAKVALDLPRRLPCHSISTILFGRLNPA